MKTNRYAENNFSPTKKLNIKDIQEKEKLFRLWDMLGQKVFRSKWLKGIQDSNIIIFMMDLANQRRFDESKKEFWNVINHPELKEIPLLIIGNKIDLFNYSKENDGEQLNTLKSEISDNFSFDKIRNREWVFLFTSVKTNFNIDNVLSTITHLLS